MLNKIKNEGVVAVIRAKDHEEALGYIKCLFKWWSKSDRTYIYNTKCSRTYKAC